MDFLDIRHGIGSLMKKCTERKTVKKKKLKVVFLKVKRIFFFTLFTDIISNIYRGNTNNKEKTFLSFFVRCKTCDSLISTTNLIKNEKKSDHITEFYDNRYSIRGNCIHTLVIYII